MLFEGIISVLSRHGAVAPVKVSDREMVYAIRDDAGPVVGSFLILVRRSANVERWLNFFRELVEGKYASLGEVFAEYLSLAMSLSRVMPKGKGGGYSLSPMALDVLSPSMKVLVQRLEKTLDAGSVGASYRL